METKRRQTSGPEHVSLAARRALGWMRKEPGAEAPGQGAPHGEETIPSGVMNLAAVQIVPGARETHRLPGITPASADAEGGLACETSRALATKFR
jgi:hypothetical protein